jgi:type I restriction enzyme, S subunit
MVRRQSREKTGSVSEASAAAFSVAAAPSLSSTSSVRLRDIVSAGLRFDASAFSIPSREAVAALRRMGTPLSPLFGVGGIATEAQSVTAFRERVYVDADHGIPFLTSSDIISMRPDVRRYLSRRTRAVESLLIRKWDVLVSCSGTIGNVGFAGDTLAGHGLSQDAIRVRCVSATDAGFVAAFLRSHYGRVQLLQAAYGSVIVHIEPAHLTQVQVPLLHPIKRIKIGQPFVEAAEARDTANRLLDEADGLLHESLGLPRLTGRSRRRVEPVSTRASSLGDRFEAAYHNARASEASRCVAATPFPIAELGSRGVTKSVIAVTKFRERVYVRRGGIPLLNSKQLFQIDPIDLKGIAKGAHTADLGEIQLAPNMLAVTCSGTIGRVQIIPDYMATWAASQDAHRVVAAADMNPGYLYAWLASDYGRELITRNTYGSVVVHIDRSQLASVPVPVPGASIRDEIGNLVLTANRLRDKAWLLEQKAIDELQQMVSKGVSDRSKKGPRY